MEEKSWNKNYTYVVVNVRDKLNFQNNREEWLLLEIWLVDRRIRMKDPSIK